MQAERAYKLDSDKELSCLEVVRSLPGKRLVFLGEYEGEKVFAKLYLDANRAEKHWRRELDGLDVINKCGISTAALIYAGRVEPGGHPVILLAQLAGLKSVRQVWGEVDNDGREQLLRRMTVLLARHHQTGMCQTDLHLDNFMLSEDEIFSLDGAGVKFYPGGVSEVASFDNLALLIAQLPPEWEKHTSEVLHVYTSERGLQQGFGYKSLLARVHKAREGRWVDLRKKLFRNCTAFTYTKYSDGFQVVSNKYANRELFDLLRNPDASFPGKELALKNGNTCTVWAVKSNGLDLVLKRYNVKDFLHGVKLRLWSGRGERSWINGHRLQFYGVSTPAPVALLKRRRGFFPTTYLLTERVEAVSAHEWFRNPDVDREDKERLAGLVANMLKSMQEQMISHGDLKATNILIADGKPSIIDLDSMCRHSSDSRFSKAWSRDINRFLQNWENNEYLQGLFKQALKSCEIEM
jgi:tRNA A-37 threonylcarbamoyl transferase component Bud32